ncbi:MAG: ribbon-helix-helix protein, CopG family [Clostridia bacterium]|nr:ribbon-helix-helix protein, CopG family [Clostridia bacterium]
MTVSVRLNEEDEKIIKAYAELNNISLSELIRKAVIEKIEDEFDLELYNKAKKEYEKNPKTYSHEEVRKMLELDEEI